MRAELAARLRCPACAAPLRADGDGLRCAASHRFPIVDGVPELLPPALLDATSQIDLEKLQERTSHDEHVQELDHGIAIDDRHIYPWLNYYQLFELMPRFQANPPRDILVAMCGSGFELELWAQLTRDISGVDISTGSVRGALTRAERLSLTGVFAAADIETLPFADRAFDLVVVHHGLHHLPSIDLAVGEMLRVSRRNVLICEPVDGPMRRMLRATRISPGVEPGGTQVRDIRPADVRRLAAAANATLVVDRELFYPRARAPRPGRVHQAADRWHATRLLRPPLRWFNRLFGRWIGTKGTYLLEKVPTR